MRTFPPGEPIVEVKHTLAGERREFPCTLVARGAGWVVVLYRLEGPGGVADLALPTGTLSFGYFWAHRSYNAYHWLSPGGQPLGLYFNVSDRTRIAPGRVSWRDLVVDVLVTPDGRCRVLDEEQLPPGLDPDLARRIRRTRDRLVRRQRALWRELQDRSARLLRGLAPGRD